ncbi:PH domain-containing protein [Natronorubrum halophilum]|uniref:PH domain-containing protein n=1 Tax=Natronorubrum halophilum TaxID=1702106 RepID=UPI000EF6787B|nr:PH domain-containing protein [Natronorubrum halophilum]
MAAPSSIDDQDLEWLSLDDSESVLWSGEPDRRTIVPTALLLVLPVLALAVVPFNWVAGIGLTAVLTLFTVPTVAWAVLWVRSTDYVVTSNGLYAKHGVLSRDVKRIDFEKVQNTSYSQSALGTHFGYGHVEVSSAGGSGVEMRFRSVPSPREIQQLISSRVKPARSPDRTDAKRTDDDVLEEILAELRAIRSTLEGGTGTPGRSDESRSTAASSEGVTFERESSDGDASN